MDKGKITEMRKETAFAFDMIDRWVAKGAHQNKRDE